MRLPTCVVVGLHNNGLGVVRALGRHGVPVVAIDRDARSPHGFTRFARVVPCSDMKGLGLIEQLRALGRRFDERAILVLTMDRSVMIVSEHRVEIEPYYRHSLPPHDLVMQMMNKAEIARMATRAGFRVPRTFDIRSQADLDASVDAMTFPCILKPQLKTPAFVDRSSSKAFRFQSREELMATYRLVREWDPAVVVQDWVDGPDRNLEFVLMYLDHESRELGIFSGRKIRQYIPYCGTACSAEPLDDPALVEHARRFFAGTGYCGFGAIEFKRADDGTYFLVEPTVGRTEHLFSLAAVNGVNLPLIGYRDMAGLPPLPQQAPRRARIYLHPRRDLKAAMTYRRAGELTIAEWARSIARPHVFPLFAWDDTRPFVRQVVGRLTARPRRLAQRAAAVGFGLRVAWKALQRGHARGHHPIRSSEEHLKAAVDWVCAAQDVDGRGVARAFALRPSSRFEAGWQPPYPETTGYTIVSMLACARQLGRDELRERAVRMGRWCVSMQLPDGGIPGGVSGSGKPSVVFNTGMVLQGWTHLYEDTPDVEFERPMSRALAFLMDVQGSDGAWRVSTNFRDESRAHTYDVLAAWALMNAGRLLHDAKAVEAARRNVAYALSRQRANGWFDENGLRPCHNARPFTHNIGYALEGVLKCARLCDDASWLAAAARGADGAMQALSPDGFLPGRLDADWNATERWACLTGTAQMAGVWFLLAQVTGEVRYREAAVAAVQYLKRSHNLTSANSGVRGGMAGSEPVSGPYCANQYPNWAAKYFLDALLLDLDAVKQEERLRAVEA